MSELSDALGRLEAAVAGLEAAAETPRTEAGANADEVVALLAERDRLRQRAETLEEAARRDAELRAEAAEAVRAALSDLRALVPEEERHG